MSNIYIVEPPTNGKVLLKTSVGDIDIELWSKEAPKACRNFLQLCLEGYYNGTIFHRVVKGFIVQGGDPTGTGTGGDSIYGEPFKDEFHTRLRFARRGLLAMANAGKDDNASQFFFTLAATPELQNKHTIFGKVSGETLFNMIKLEDALVDRDERPVYPQRIIRTEVLYNPMTDIIPRTLPSSDSKSLPEKSKKKEKKGGVKNFKLLSFGSEAEDDEEETEKANKKYTGRSKSTHDILQDPGLSAEPAVDDVPDDFVVSRDEADSEQMDRIRKKLRLDKSSKDVEEEASTAASARVEEEEEEEEAPYILGQARREELKKKAEDIRKEIRDLKRGYQSDKKKKQEEDVVKAKETENSSIKSTALEEYEKDQEKYKLLKNQLLKKGQSREEFTLSMLAKFQKKLSDAKEKVEENEEAAVEPAPAVDDNIDDDTWLTHKLHFETQGPTLAKDASTKTDDWFDITDPRNPINKRRREANKPGSSKQERR